MSIPIQDPTDMEKQKKSKLSRKLESFEVSDFDSSCVIEEESDVGLLDIRWTMLGNRFI